MGSDSAEEQKQGKKRKSTSKRASAGEPVSDSVMQGLGLGAFTTPRDAVTAHSTEQAEKWNKAGAKQQATLDVLTRVASGDTSEQQARAELADVLAVEAVAGPIAGDASNAIDATPEQLGEVTSTKAPSAKQLKAAQDAQTRLTASAQSNTDGSNDAALSAALATVTPENNPSDHVTGAAQSTGSDAHTAEIRKAGINALVTSSIDKTFSGAVIGISPDLLRVLVCVDAPGLTPHRHGQNVWLPVATTQLITEAQSTGKGSKRAQRKAARNSSTASTTTTTDATPNDTTEENSMATKSTKTSKKSTKSTASKSTSTAQGTSTGKRAAKKSASASTTPKAKRGVITSEALDALPQALRAGVEAVRLNWATDKFAKPKTLKFAAGASAGGYKAAGQVWGHIDVADTEFNKFWRFHFQQKGDKYIVNRTLSYDSVEAAKNAAEYCAQSLGVANPEHFAFKF